MAADDQSRIRNFCIIAHIDHGKSTLADRLLELTHTVEGRKMRAQLLDQLDLEQERGITIKLQPVRMAWRPSVDSRWYMVDGEEAKNSTNYQLPTTNYDSTEYQLNLIDTPGHVDFSYEVSRSLAAVEGALLVVDATQGIQAQTLANIYLALEADLAIIPVLNKIDLPAAEPERVRDEIVNLLGCKPEEVLRASGKTGEGVEAVMDAVVARIPSPGGTAKQTPRALIFDSLYDAYRGVLLYVRMVDGQLRKNDKLHLLGSGKQSDALEVGSFTPAPEPSADLATGQIGYIVTNFKSVRDARVGDTVTLAQKDLPAPLPGYKRAKPFVYAGFFPASAERYEELRRGLEQLQLNDAALEFTPERSGVLGLGYRIGFLGLLHLDIVKARLEREYGVELIVTSPSTDYEIVPASGEPYMVRAATEMPEQTQISEIREPWISGEIIVPKDYLGNVLQLINATRGHQTSISYLDAESALIAFKAPLANVLTDFYDRLKSATSGYGSFSYELSNYASEDLVRLDILVGGEAVDSLSQIVHRDEADATGRQALQKLQDVIPRQLFEVALQAAIGGKIIARETIKPLGKNVTAKLYGGDVSRKKKLWAKQKEGKKRMKSVGKVDIPPEAFAVLLKKG